MTTTELHPARQAALASQAAVREKRRDDWVALFASDGWVEDPVGPSGFDPEGNGHHGAEAIGKFWDMTIANTDSIEFRYTDSYAGGAEVAFVGTVRSIVAGTRIDAEGVFVYRVTDDGKLQSLRAFWEVERAFATATPVTA